MATGRSIICMATGRAFPLSLQYKHDNAGTEAPSTLLLSTLKYLPFPPPERVAVLDCVQSALKTIVGSLTQCAPETRQLSAASSLPCTPRQSCLQEIRTAPEGRGQGGGARGQGQSQSLRRLTVLVQPCCRHGAY